MIEELRMQIGSRRGDPATARRSVLARRREASQDRSLYTAVCVVITPRCVVLVRNCSPSKEASTPETRNAEDEGAGWCCWPIPEQVYFAVTVAVHTAPECSGDDSLPALRLPVLLN
jgi:hypothetical protein